MALVFLFAIRKVSSSSSFYVKISSDLSSSRTSAGFRFLPVHEVFVAFIKLPSSYIYSFHWVQGNHTWNQALLNRPWLKLNLYKKQGLRPKGPFAFNVERRHHKVNDMILISG